MECTLSEILGPPTLRYRIPIRDKNKVPTGAFWDVSETTYETLGRPKFIIMKN